MTPDAVLCIACGFDTRIGKRRTADTSIDTLDFPLSMPLRIVAALVGLAFVTIVLMTILPKVGDELSLDLVLGFFCYSLLIAIVGLVVWRCTIRISVLRGNQNTPIIEKTFLLGPFKYRRKWELAAFDSVWFVQRPSDVFRDRKVFVIFSLITSCGLAAIPLLMMSSRRELRYRAELRGSTSKAIVLYRGAEQSKYRVNSIVRMIRDAGTHPLKNDIQMFD